MRRTRLQNAWLLLVSVVFYAWGEVGFVGLMLGSTLMNYVLGLWLDLQTEPRRRKSAVVLAVALNIGLLAFFKYANFFVASLNGVLEPFRLPKLAPTHIPLPIGISFFTFHALSYVVDIYRGKWKAARYPQDVALYIFFFPQLIAGPILRWSAIAPQLIERRTTLEQFAEGVRRFVGGLAKKVMLANVVALPADQIFHLPANELGAPVAWFGAICYSLQIYFDFSGYSDMAVGLGKMFGFRFLENFDFPYIAQSVKDFWRRWHISLSTWFRDYLYIPLGGNRCSAGRTHLNLLLVFFLCGLWHGASWTFVVWGLYHGIFLVLERTPFGERIDGLPRPVRHGYTLVVVMVGWVLFRADSFSQAIHFLLAMGGLAQAPAPQALNRYLTNQAAVAVLAGLVFSLPVWRWVNQAAKSAVERASAGRQPYLRAMGILVETALVTALLFASTAWLASGTYNPFIYFRF